MSWYYKMNDVVQGPVERDALIDLLRKGILTPQVEVSDNKTTWLIAPQIPGLISEVFGTPVEATVAKPAAAAASPTPAAPSASPTQIQAPSTQIAGPPTAPSSVIATPAPVNPAPATATCIQAPGANPVASPSIPQPSGSAAVDSPEANQESNENVPPPAEAIEEAQRPSGPVGHIVLDPSARQRAATRPQGSGFLKTAVCGVLGLIVIAAAGLFVAYKFFGIDIRPPAVDRSVSKFMVQSPDLVAHIDMDAVWKSDALTHAIQMTGLEGNPQFGYVKDAGEITLVSDSLDPTSPRFLAIITLKRDYRSEFIANLFRDASTENIGSYAMHTDSRGIGGVAIAASLPEPRTLLVGSPQVVKSVLARNDYPRLSPRESALIAASTSNGKAASIGMFLDSFESPLAEAKAEANKQLKALEKEDRKRFERMFKPAIDAHYAVKNIKHLTIDIELSDKVEVVTHAECANFLKAKKVARILKSLMASAPSGSAQMDSFTSSAPVAKGSTVEGTLSFEIGDFSNALTSQLASQGY